MITFNAENGYLEAIVRGFRLGLISGQQYNNFCQCESLEDLRVQLNGTEYGDLTHSMQAPITTSSLGHTMRHKFVEEFRYLQQHASGNLARFLEYLTYEYQIDNVVFIITSMMHESVSPEELVERCHPLGLFDALPALTVARTVEELYNTVLVETPLAPYFRDCLTAKDLDDFNVEIIRNTLHRAYLEDLYRFCKDECDSTTAAVMGSVLTFEADRRTLNVILNSLGTDVQKDVKLRLLPKFGKLHEMGVSEKLVRAEELLQVRSIIESDCPEYRQLMDAAMSHHAEDKMNMHSGTLDVGVRSLEEYFFEREVAMCREAMQFQFSFCPFYSWVKLKEQELRNIVWIAECIAQKQKENIHHFIPIY